MIKSEMQEQFESNVVKCICYTADSPGLCSKQISDFISKCDVYYDLLCRNIYEMCVDPSDQGLWFSLPAKTYLSKTQQGKDDICLLYSQEIPLFQDDIEDTLLLVCSRLEYLSNYVASVYEFSVSKPS